MDFHFKNSCEGHVSNKSSKYSSNDSCWHLINPNFGMFVLIIYFSYSKKDSALRRKELRDAVSKPMLQLIVDHAKTLAMNNTTLLLILAILRHSQGRSLKRRDLLNPQFLMLSNSGLIDFIDLIKKSVQSYIIEIQPLIIDKHCKRNQYTDI